MNFLRASFLPFILLCSPLSYAQRGSSTLLPESATKEVLRMHVIRAKSLGGYWKPTEAEIATLDSLIPKVSEMRSEGVLVGMQIAEPAKDNKQYVAIMVNGRKTIYVNAFCMPFSSDWKSRLEVISDGATCVWHVLYDVETRTFSHLMTNGRA